MNEHDKVSMLVVGDQPARLQACATSLRALDRTLVTLSSPLDVLRWPPHDQPAVIVLDASAPALDAFATAAMIRRQPRFEETPIILLTSPDAPGYDPPDDAQLGAILRVDVAAAPRLLPGMVAPLVTMHRQRLDLARLRQALDVARAELARAHSTRQTEATERERAEGALRQTQARLSVILESTSVAIGQIDLDNRFVYVNRGFEELFDLVGTDVRGRSLHELLRPEIAEAFEANCRRVLADDRPYGFEEISETADRMFTYNAVNSPIRDEAGSPCGVVCVFTDITERKRLESALLDADRRKDEFLAVLAHELRNPLAPILNAAQLMTRKATDDPELRWCSEVVKRQTDHLARLVDDLLDVARITQGKIALKCDRMEIGEAVARAIEANRPLLDARHQALRVIVADPSPRVHGDLTRLSQVIGNLLNNAAKYTDPGGTVELRVEQVPSERSSAGDVLVRIKDTGMGIPKEMLPRIFDLFTQVDSRARAQGGLGIGLSIVARLVQMHGGTVQASSPGVGRGSEFVVRLPALRDKPLARGRRPGAGAPTPQASGLGVLVVVANRDSVQSLAILLRMAGHLVETAHDGLEAVEAAERFRPNVILMDIGMPKLDGYEATRRIRAHEWGRDALIVALTGWGQEDARALTAAAGFDAHLIKPVDFDVLSRLMTVGRTPAAPHSRPD